MDSAAISILAYGLDQATYQHWLEAAFYPALFLIFVIASLGVPIPEDVPLIAAGVLLNTHPEIASWTGTIIVSAIGIMSGDIILYTAGRRWGSDVFAHRWVRWLITPERLEAMRVRFHRHGVWMVFFGRFIVGIRAMMCITAGVTRFKFHRFLAADLCGIAITIPLFLGLGYAFADVLPRLQSVLGGVQLGVLIAVGALIVGGVAFYWLRSRRRASRESPPTAGLGRLATDQTVAAAPAPAAPALAGSARTPRAGDPAAGRASAPVVMQGAGAIAAPPRPSSPTPLT